MHTRATVGPIHGLSAVIIGILWVTVQASVAAAVIHTGDYVVRQHTVTVADHHRAAVSAHCPAHMRVVMGGAFWHRQAEDIDASLVTEITGSAPALDAKSWYASGVNLDAEPLQLTVRTFCLAGVTIGPYNVVTREALVPAGAYGSRQAVCPDGQNVISGGGVWHEAGQAPNASLHARVTQSTGLNGVSRWTVVGRNESRVALRLRVMALCVDAGDYPNPAGATGNGGPVASGAHAETTVTCGGGNHILSGNATWAIQSRQSDPNLTANAIIVSAAATSDATSWHVAGWNNDSRGLILAVSVVCAPD